MLYFSCNFQFRYTATQRAQQSARYFTIGLFNKRDSQNVVYSPASKVDMVLRVSFKCVTIALYGRLIYMTFFVSHLIKHFYAMNGDK